MMPIYDALWPLLNLLGAVEVMPCLTTSLIEESPAIDVGGPFF